MQLDPANRKTHLYPTGGTIEDNILKGIYPEETQIPSTTEVAMVLKVKSGHSQPGGESSGGRRHYL